MNETLLKLLDDMLVAKQNVVLEVRKKQINVRDAEGNSFTVQMEDPTAYLNGKGLAVVEADTILRMIDGEWHIKVPSKKNPSEKAKKSSPPFGVIGVQRVNPGVSLSELMK